MKRISHRNYLVGHLYLRLLPVVVWLAVVGIVVGLFSMRAKRFEVIGIAEGQLYQVAATNPGRITDIPVELFSEVKKGQTVAVVDSVLDDEITPEQIRFQLATIQAEVEHLLAQLSTSKDTLLADKSDRENNHIVDMRRFAVDVENARLEILSLKALLASDQIVLGDLAMEVKITQHLLKQEAVTPYELQKAKVQYNTLAQKIAENEQMLEQAKKDLQEAIQRQDKYAKQELYIPPVDNALDVIRKAANVQERLKDELLAALEALEARKALEFKAPFDGVVSQILHRPGEAVLAGEPIVTITEARPREIIGYVSEVQSHQIEKGMKVELIKTSKPEQIAYSKITYVGPNIEQMPMQLWRNPNFPQWGRPFSVEVPDKIELLTGETIGIRKL